MGKADVRWKQYRIRTTIVQEQEGSLIDLKSKRHWNLFVKNLMEKGPWKSRHAITDRMLLRLYSPCKPKVYAIQYQHADNQEETASLLERGRQPLGTLIRSP